MTSPGGSEPLDAPRPRRCDGDTEAGRRFAGAIATGDAPEPETPAGSGLRHRAVLSAVVVLGGAVSAVGMYSLGLFRSRSFSWDLLVTVSALAIPVGVAVAAGVARVGVLVRNRADLHLAAHPVRRASMVVGVLAFVAALVGGLLLTAGGWQLDLVGAVVCACLAGGCAALVLR